MYCLLCCVVLCVVECMRERERGDRDRERKRGGEGETRKEEKIKRVGEKKSYRSDPQSTIHNLQFTVICTHSISSVENDVTSCKASLYTLRSVHAAFNSEH